MSSDSNVPLLRATNLRKAFYHPKPVDVLKKIDLTVYAGESVAIVGRSGEGKSTLLQILGTLEQPCSGSLEIGGQEVSSANRCMIRNQWIGFVFQSFHLLEDYTALDNVLMPARIGRQKTWQGSQARSRAMELLESVGLANRVHFHTKLLSGGEKQRVALARAMCNDPQLILADEPSGNLDRETSHLIHDLLLGFTRQQQKALIIVTHDLDLAHLCDRQLELKSGCLVPYEF